MLVIFRTRSGWSWEPRTHLNIYVGDRDPFTWVAPFSLFICNNVESGAKAENQPQAFCVCRHLQYWQSMSGCCFKSWLLHFWSGFTLMCFRRQWKVSKNLASAVQSRRPDGCSLLQNGPDLFVIAIWGVKVSLCCSTFQIKRGGTEVVCGWLDRCLTLG